MYSASWKSILLSSLWLDLFLTDAAALSIPSVPTNLLHSQNLIGMPPEEFSIVIEPVRGPIVSEPLKCIEAGIQVVGQALALEDFTGRIPAQSWAVSNVVIAVATALAPGSTIERRFVIWGIYQALMQLTAARDFRTAVFTLKWRGNIDGSLALYPKGLSTVNVQSNLWSRLAKLDSSVSTIGKAANSSALSTTSALEAGDITIRIHHKMPIKPLVAQDLLMSLIVILMGVAEPPAEQILRSSLMITNPHNSMIILVSGPNRKPPSSAQPYLRIDAVIKAVTQIPAVLSLTQSYDCFKADILLDLVIVGQIIVSLTPSRIVLPPLNSSFEANVYNSIAQAEV